MSLKTGTAAALLGATVSLYAIDAMAQDYRYQSGRSYGAHMGYRAAPHGGYAPRRPYVAPAAVRMTHREASYQRTYYGRRAAYRAPAYTYGTSRSYGYGYGAGYVAQPQYATYGYATQGYASAGYAVQQYQYAQPQTYSRTYAVPTTAYQPVTRTYTVPVTSYQQVQRTEYVPTTVYRQVTKTCTCQED